jgi:hypothetical protein
MIATDGPIRHVPRALPILVILLFTYYRQVGNGAGACIEPVGVANFSCLEGRCGDGKCEAGEQGACGCDADCGP